MKLPKNSHRPIHKNGNIFKYNYNFVDQLLLPYKLYGREMMGTTFLILPVVSR